MADEMLKKIKRRCDIADSIDYYDDQIKDLILAAKMELMQAGINNEMLETKDQYLAALVLNTIAAYVKTYLGNDRSDTNRYLKAYESMRFKLSLETGGGEDV